MPTQRGSAPVLIILLILISAIIGVSGYYFYSKFAPEPNPKNSSEGFLQKQFPVLPIQKTTLFEGKLTRLDKDLGLIVQTEEEKMNNTQPTTIYYSAGKYLSGDYKGYTRYVAVREAFTPSGAAVYIFASNDNQKYIFDLNNNRNYIGDNPLNEIDKNKIEKVAELPSDHPQIIILDQTFALNRNKISTTSEKTDKKSKEGYDIYHEIINESALSNPTLTSPLTKLTFYSDIIKQPVSDPKNISPNQAALEQALSYIQGTTEVTVTDSTGLPYTYDFTRPKLAESYPAKYQQYQKEMEAYDKALNKENLTYPTYPWQPNLRLTKDEITTSSPIYNNYDVALPHACATDVNTKVAKNITDADLTKIGSSPDGDLFVLKNKNHPLLKYAYQIKVADYDDQAYKWNGNNSPKPTYEEYIAKNPLLFLKDNWGRWVMLGEYDIKFVGGCGKPVIYLYPPVPTKVSIKFATPINFDVAIPNYAGGWFVLANPNGVLNDLQTEKTDCKKIDENKKGSEYAVKACEANSYPYLYWAGSVLNQKYPKINEGWIVDKQNLTSFLDGKMNEMGFNKKEKADFLEYWVPELLAKKSLFYKISFLGSRELDKMIPMLVNPKPDNYFRIFMDWETLDQLPSVLPNPQNLEKIKRTGFTLVEWGGEKK